VACQRLPLRKRVGAVGAAIIAVAAAKRATAVRDVAAALCGDC
jgi:hypothetical protein